EALPARGRPEELRVGFHRVALGDAAAAHDAERLLVDRVHPLLRDDALLSGALVVAGAGRPRSVFTAGRVPTGESPGTCPASTIGFIRSLQASTARPSMRIPQEPQIIMRQLLRYAGVPSWRRLVGWSAG